MFRVKQTQNMSESSTLSRRWPIVLASALILALALSLSPAQADHLSTKQDELKDVTEKLEDTRDFIKDSKVREKSLLGESRELDVKVSGLQEELGVIEEDLDLASNRRETAEQKLNRRRAELADVQRELGEQEKEVYRSEGVLSDRLVSLYKLGPESYLEVLLGSRDFSDLVSRFTFLLNIEAQDEHIVIRNRDLRDEFRSLEREVAAKKIEANGERDKLAIEERRVESLKNRTEKKKSSLKSEQNRKVAVMAEVQEDREEAERLEDELERESQSIAAWLASQGTSAVMDTGQMMKPVLGRESSQFGYRTHPISGRKRLHAGLDIAAPYGTAVWAADSGKVIYAGYRGGYGNTIIIDHGGGLTTLYGHNSSLVAGTGTIVTKGQVIAKVGSTGYSTGNHSHWEVRVNGAAKNPKGYL